MKDILAPAADWTGQTWAGRIDQCASMLFCHGYIPMSVRDKIARMLIKECEAAIATEAGTAATVEQGAVHEGAGRQPSPESHQQSTLEQEKRP